MTLRGFSLAVLALAAALISTGGCAKQSENPGTGGVHGTTSSTHSTTTQTNTADAGTGGMGTGGTGTGGMATGGMGTGGTAMSGSSSSGASSSSGTGGTGTGGTGGTGTGGMGTGGTGATCQPPLGSPDYPAEQEPNDLKSQANLAQAGTKGLTASICPLGDIDVFEFKVTQPGTSVSVATSDGMGGCPAGAHTYVRLFDDANNVLAQSGGSGGCVSFNGSTNPALIGLPVGNYYVHIESATLDVIPFYVVDIKVTAPSCGDSIVQVGSGEQCDHGANNGAAGDGCSASCQILSGNYVNESEPNNSQATGNNLDGKAGAVGQISPVGDVDFYTVHVTVPGSAIWAEIGDGFGGCPLSFDSRLTLYSPGATQLATDSGGGVSPCSKITPLKYMGAANLPVGLYALKVERLSPATQQYYVLKVNVTTPGCGDGILPEGTKQCDPGPGMTNPGCSATCQLTGDFIPETEPNDTQALANPLGTHAGFIGAIKPTGDLDYYSFTVPGPQSLVFIATGDGLGGCPSGLQSTIRLYDPGGTQIVQDSISGVGGSLISPAIYPAAMNLAGGTYKVRVEYTGNNASYWQYVVTIATAQPGCGDGIIQTGEQCDDGPSNGTTGDGCSATCQAIPPWEIEPNDSTATATPQWPGFSTWKGSIRTVGDHDYFTFNVATSGTVTLVTHDVDTPTVCSTDTVIYLLDHNGLQLAMDDDSGPGPGSGGGRCSQISNIAVTPGTYYAWVQHYHDTTTIPKYQIDFTVQ